MTPEQMRQEILKVYSASPKYQKTVRRMRDAQVIAIYLRLRRKGLTK